MTDRQERPTTDAWAKAYHWFRRHAVPSLRLTPIEQAVYATLADHADNDGITWPSVPLIAFEANCSERSVRTAFDRLTEAGLIAVERDAASHAPTWWRIVERPPLPEMPERPRSVSQRRSPVDNSGGAECTHAPGAGQACTSCRPRHAGVAAEGDPLSRPIEVDPPNAHRTRRASAEPTAKQLSHLLDLRAAMRDYEDDDERARVPASRAEATRLIRLYRGEQAQRIHKGLSFDCALADLSAGARRYFEDRDLTHLFDQPAAVTA